MTLLYIFVALVVGFTVGYIFKGQTFAEKKSVPQFSEADAEKGRKAIALRIEKRKSRIMERARQEGRITNDEVEDLFCISDHTARNYLNDLEKDGKLIQHGRTGRGVFYTPINRQP